MPHAAGWQREQFRRPSLDYVKVRQGGNGYLIHRLLVGEAKLNRAQTLFGRDLEKCRGRVWKGSTETPRRWAGGRLGLLPDIGSSDQMAGPSASRLGRLASPVLYQGTACSKPPVQRMNPRISASVRTKAAFPRCRHEAQIVHRLRVPYLQV